MNSTSKIIVWADHARRSNKIVKLVLKRTTDSKNDHREDQKERWITKVKRNSVNIGIYDGETLVQAEERRRRLCHGNKPQWLLKTKEKKDKT